MSNDVFRVYIMDEYRSLLKPKEPTTLLMKIYRHDFQDPSLDLPLALQSSMKVRPEPMIGFSQEFFYHYLESAWMNHLSNAKEPLAPKIYMDFQNGRLEEFLAGQVLTNKQMKDPFVSQAIARKLSKLHLQSAELLAVTQNIYARIRGSQPTKILHPLDFPRHYWKVIEKSYERAMKFLSSYSSVPIAEKWEALRMSLLTEKFFDAVTTVKQLTLALDERKWAVHPPSGMTFIHWDLQPGNIMMKEATGDVEFIDYEYGNFGPPLLDIANHFNEWAFLYDGPNNSLIYDPQLQPSQLQIIDFLKTYHLSKIQGVGEVLDEQLEEDLRLVHFYMLVSDLKWALWSIEKFIDRYEEYRKTSCSPLARSGSFSDLLPGILQGTASTGEYQPGTRLHDHANADFGGYYEPSNSRQPQFNGEDLDFMTTYGFYLDLCRYKIDHFVTNWDGVQYAKASEGFDAHPQA